MNHRPIIKSTFEKVIEYLVKKSDEPRQVTSIIK